MINFLEVVWENDWTPHNLIDRTTINEHFKEEINKTEFGKLVDILPAILALLFLIVYYIIMSVLWTILCPTIGILKFVIYLFTKTWRDFY